MITVLAKWLATVETNKTFWMPIAIQSRNAFVQDGIAASGTFGRKQGMVAFFAIRLAIAFEEILCCQFLKIGRKKDKKIIYKHFNGFFFTLVHFKQMKCSRWNVFPPGVVTTLSLISP